MEDAEYLAAGSPYGAKDGPFDSVDELQLVAGMTRDLYRMLRPSLTVHSGQSGVNASDASLTVLLALGAERKAAEDYIERRAARMPGQAAPPVPVRTLKFVSRSSSSVFRIHAAARTASGAAADVTAIVDLRPQADQEEPYTLRDWRHEPARMSSSPGGTP
jgi:general secretion pathway protein K